MSRYLPYRGASGQIESAHQAARDPGRQDCTTGCRWCERGPNLNAVWPARESCHSPGIACDDRSAFAQSLAAVVEDVPQSYTPEHGGAPCTNDYAVCAIT